MAVHGGSRKNKFLICVGGVACYEEVLVVGFRCLFGRCTLHGPSCRSQGPPGANNRAAWPVAIGSPGKASLFLLILVVRGVCGWSWKQVSEPLYVYATSFISNPLLSSSYAKSGITCTLAIFFNMTHTTSMSILVLGHFANFKLAGDRAVRDAVHLFHRESSSTSAANGAGQSQIRTTARPRRRRRGIRARHVSRSTRVGVMSDADLEAELAARRAARARERERYARSMRTEKLSLLEGELMRLRSEISRLGRPSGSGVGSGTPPNARWEPLPQARNRATGSPLGRPSASYPNVPSVPLSNPPGTGPPPPPPPGGVAWKDEEPIDPERQRREKEERVKRREAKRKEREAGKKPMTLADIIRGAGPDPMRRLKPSGSTQLEDVFEFEELKTEDFSDVKDALKKVERDAKSTQSGKDGSEASQKDASKEEGNNKDCKAKDDEKVGTEKDAPKPTATSNGDGTDVENGKKSDAKRDDSSKNPSSAETGQEAKSSNSTNVSEGDGKKTDDSQQAPSKVPTIVSEEKLGMKKQTESADGVLKNANGKGQQSTEQAELSISGEEKTSKSAGKKGTSNGVDTSDAVSALSSLAEKLSISRKATEGSQNSGDSRQKGPNESNTASDISSGTRKKLSLAEKRRKRRSSAEPNSETAGNLDSNGISPKADLKAD